MVYRQLPGQADSPSREPERIQPVPEHYEGVVFPYRGTEQHGVAVPKDAKYNTREFQYPEEAPDEFLPAEDEPDPIPVRVVTSSSRERLDWRALRVRVTDRPQQILGRHDKRKGVRVKVHALTDGVASGLVFLGNDSGMQHYTGYQMDAGEVMHPIVSTENIWAVCEDGQTAEISVMYEFAVEL